MESDLFLEVHSGCKSGCFDYVFQRLECYYVYDQAFQRLERYYVRLGLPRALLVSQDRLSNDWDVIVMTRLSTDWNAVLHD